MACATPSSSIQSEESSNIEETKSNSKKMETETDLTDQAMSRLLQRMKTDMMYELRSIEHSQRPVTGQEHREHLRQFMKKHIIEPSQLKGNVPSNVDDVTDHRPQSVVVEVQGVIEQRPVSSVLQSAAFRQRLENIIRGSIQSTRQQPTPLNARRQRPRIPLRSTQQPPQQNQATPSVDVQRPDIHQRLPCLPSLPSLPSTSRERRNSTDSVSSVDSFSSARSSVDPDEDFEDTPNVIEPSTAAVGEQPRLERDYREEVERAPLPAPRRSMLSSPSPARASPAPSDNNITDRQEQNGGGGWPSITDIHREEMVQELSELLHNRLVSSTLDSEFRATLEVLINDRVDNNGPIVQEFVQSLPGRGIPRNDFSHLGIGPFNDIDNSDNISVTSISTHSVPYNQTNTFLRKEILGLKSQMKEMVNMIKMTHDLQLDIQRSIRQEVAAALSQVSTAEGGACASAASIAPRSTPVKDTHCLICLDNYSDTVLYQCGHMCVCYLCGKNLMAKKLCCPVCRAPIKDVIRAYKTNAE